MKHSRMSFHVVDIDYDSYLYISIFSCWLAFLGYSQSLLDMNVSSSIDLEARDEGKSAGIFSLRFLRCYYIGSCLQIFFCCISRLPALFVGPVFIIELRCAHVLPELKYVCNFNSQSTFDNAFSIFCIGGGEGRWIDPPLLLDPRLRRAPLS